MKRTILAGMLALFCQVAFLQTGYSQHNGQMKGKGSDRTPEQRADAHVKKMTQDLGLSTEQVPKVKVIMLDKIQKSEAIRTKYANATDKKAMHQEMKALRDQKETELKAVLTPDQYTKHQQLMEQHKQQRMQGKGKDKNHQGKPDNAPDGDDDDGQ
ncbi:MAG: hypothetical protein ACJ75J_17980 [Cytophagaceae bacterium]